jgi:hypothetical protein
MTEAPESIVLREPLDIFAHFDALDDAAIVDEMEGKLASSAVYHFNQDGKELWGLGKVGVDWCANELAKKGYIIRDEELQYQQDPTDSSFILFSAKVGKYFVDKSGLEAKVDSAIGTKRQWTKLKRRDGSIITDTFWFEKGSQKAIRNARMRLIPEETKAAIITAAKSGGRVREVKGSAASEVRGQGAQTTGDGEGQPSPAPPSPGLSKFYLLKEIGAEKDRVGADRYYALLKNGNFSHADEVPPERRTRLLDILCEMESDPKFEGPDEGDGPDDN